MLFTEPLFLFGFLPVAVGGYWLLPAQGAARRLWILIASVAFYGAASLPWLLLLVGMTAVTYLATAYLMAGTTAPARRLGLALVLGTLLVLGAFKYLDASALARGSSVARVVLPIGISFYTFNLVGYGLDVYRRRVTPAASFVDLAAYALFFPTVTSGPLMRWSELRPQLDAARPTADHFERAVFSLTCGFAKKLLVADWLATVGEPLWSNASGLGLGSAWIALLSYHFRLYYDFSGYSDIAIGLGHLLGIRIPANFRAPYSARSVTDFWQRWHITLSQWFRDYLFFPLSRALLRHGGTRHPDLTRATSLVITMTLIGLWHGPTPGFLVWGAYHGVLLAANAQFFGGRARTPWPLARFATTVAVLAGWVLFRSPSLAAAGGVFRGLLGGNGWGPAPTSLPGVTPAFLMLLGLLAVLTNLPRDTVDLQPRRGWIYATALAAVLVLALMRMGEPTGFIYFQF